MGKPYSVVRFIDYAPYNDKDEKGNKKELLSGIINFKMEVITSLHVGSGMQFLDDKNSIYNAFYKWNKQYVIPGSTLKGCIRHIAESISHSCFSGKFKYDKKIYKPIKNKTEEKDGKCIVCDVFGSMGMKSKVQISQLILEKGHPCTKLLPNLKGPHITESLLEDDKIKGYKFYHHGKENIILKGEVPYEVLPKGSIFTGKINYKGISQEELNLLCFSLGFSGEIMPKLGYGKPAYMGSVRFIPDEQKYEQYAKTYKENADAEVQQAISELCDILDYKNAKSISEWDESGNY